MTIVAMKFNSKKYMCQQILVEYSQFCRNFILVTKANRYKKKIAEITITSGGQIE